jgi:cell wall-associated NlpC family hydrolase
MSATVDDFIPMIETQAGDPYVFGAETKFSDPNPPAFDCSELVEWGLARIGVAFVDGAANQLAYCRGHQTTIKVESGLTTRGALLFRIGVGSTNHVAVSLGNGWTFEARGKAYGVNTFRASGRTWTHAAKVPGLIYGIPPAPRRGPMDEDEKRLLFEVLARIDNKSTDIDQKVGAIFEKVGLGKPTPVPSK